jgi:TRAP-type C4-dicarboxylate transport system substrate-binding protein
MKKIAILIFLTMVMVSASAVPVFADDNKVYTIKFAWNDMWGPKFRASQIYRPGGEMERMLSERSNGRLKMKIISRMFPGTDIIKAVATGKADAGDVPMVYHSGTYPLWNWGEIPGIVNMNPMIGFGEELAVYNDPKVKAFYDKTMGKIGLKFWFVTQWDPCNGIWSKKEIKTLDDVKGLKIWTPGYLPTKGMKALGASTVSMPGSEVAPALMTGAIDASLQPMAYGYSIGLAKIAKHFTLTPISPTWSAVTVVNKKFFAKLPQDLQDIFLEVGMELQQMVNLSTQAEYVLSADAVDMSGIKRSELEPASKAEAQKRLKVIEEEWIKLSGKEGQELLPLVKDAVKRHRAFKTGK